MASGNLEDDTPSSQSINDLLSESRKFLQTQKSLHSSDSVTESSSVRSSERQKSHDVVADGAYEASNSPRSNTSVVNHPNSTSNNSNQSILSQPGIDKNTRSGFSSSSRSSNKNPSHVELDVIGGQNSQIKSQNSILSSQSLKPSDQNILQTSSKEKSSHRSMVDVIGGQNSQIKSQNSILSSQSLKPSDQNILQTSSKEKSSHRSMVETGSRGSKNGLSAEEIHNNQTPTVRVTEQKSSSQSVSEKISAYLSRQSIVQQSESFNESRASSLKLKIDDQSVSLGSICFSSPSAAEFDGENSDVRKKSQSGLLKSSISIPKVASFQQKSNTALKPSNCNLEDLTALSQQIVVSPNACTEKINIARSRHRMLPHSVVRRKKNSLPRNNSKIDTGNVSRTSLSKSSSSSKRTLSQKISALLTRRSSNSGSSSKSSSARSSEKDKLSQSKLSSVQSEVGGSDSRHRSSDMGVVQAKSLSGKLASLSDQRKLVCNSVDRIENTADIKPKSNSRFSIAKSNSRQHSLRNSSNISNGQSKSSNLGSCEKLGNCVSDKMIQSKSGGGLSTSPSILNVERTRESIVPACSRQSNVERRESIAPACSRQSNVERKESIAPACSRQSNVERKESIAPACSRQSNVERKESIAPACSRQSNVERRESIAPACSRQSNVERKESIAPACSRQSNVERKESIAPACSRQSNVEPKESIAPACSRQSNVERKESIAPACSRQSNLERRENIVSACSIKSYVNPFADSPHSKIEPCRSIEVEKCSETSFKRNCEPHSTLSFQLSKDQHQHEDGTSFGPNVNTPQLTINGTPLLDNSNKSSHSSYSHDINNSGSENGHDFHPTSRNSLSNFDEWLADRNKYLDSILNRIHKLESDSSAHLHRHQISETSNEDKFNRILRIVRDQGRLTKDLERNIQAHQSVISFVQEQSTNSCQSIHEIGYLVKELYIYFKRLAESSSKNNQKFCQDMKDVCFTVYAVKKQLDALRSSIRNHTVSV